MKPRNVRRTTSLPHLPVANFECRQRARTQQIVSEGTARGASSPLQGAGRCRGAKLRRVNPLFRTPQWIARNPAPHEPEPSLNHQEPSGRWRDRDAPAASRTAPTNPSSACTTRSRRRCHGSSLLQASRQREPRRFWGWVSEQQQVQRPALRATNADEACLPNGEYYVLPTTTSLDGPDRTQRRAARTGAAT